MSVKLVEQEILRFLTTPDTEVVCIKGKWGVGKTFAWNQYFKAAISTGIVSLKRYSYVSLFGQNSLEELRYAIFESTVNLDQIESGANTETISKSLGFIEKHLRRLGPTLLGYIPKLKDYAPLLARSFFLAVRKQIVCIDDLERVGEGLSIKDVLGTVSFLKDQRGCKVVLLLNDEELLDKSVEDFKRQLEKVADVEMCFEPTPQETAQIGVDTSTPFCKKLAQISTSLGIVNIRVIRKIQRMAKRLGELLSGHDPRVFEAALPSVVLFGWVLYQPSLAPALDFIKSFNSLSHFFDKDKKETELEKDLRLRLGLINFSHFDEFDQKILNSMQRGYFDVEEIEAAAKEFDNKLKVQDENNSFHAAWGKYHASFEKNDNEVLSEMYKAFKDGVSVISPQNLDNTVDLFRKLGRDKQADEMIDFYMTHRSEKKNFMTPKGRFSCI